MPFEVRMGHDGILRIFLSGDLDQMIIDRLDRELAPFIEASTPEQPLKRMMFFEEMDNLSKVLRKYLTELDNDQRIGKTAYINPPRHFKVLAQFINKATGHTKIKIFDQENEALRWFLNHLETIE